MKRPVRSSRTMLTIIAVVVIVTVVVAAAMTMNTKSPADKKEITVFAAASLSSAFAEVGKNFEANHTNVKVSFNFDGSAYLKTQLLNGATADIFASADNKNMEAVAAANLIDNSTIHTFTKNRLVVILPSGNPAGITSLSDLAKPGIKIVIGDTSVPIGNYTRNFLKTITNSSSDYTDFQTKVMTNVVSQESAVTNIVTKVSLGEADAGIVYSTDAASAGSKVTKISIPDAFNVIAVYPIAELAAASHHTEVSSFIGYVVSAEGQAVMSKYGFITAV
jgi:molybdate transport system substrate-binding protein